MPAPLQLRAKVLLYHVTVGTQEIPKSLSSLDNIIKYLFATSLHHNRALPSLSQKPVPTNSLPIKHLVRKGNTGGFPAQRTNYERVANK